MSYFADTYTVDQRRSMLADEITNAALLHQIQHIVMTRPLWIRLANEKMTSEAYNTLRSSKSLQKVSVLLSAPITRSATGLEIVEVESGEEKSDRTLQLYQERTRELVEILHEESKVMHPEWNSPCFVMAKMKPVKI
jgi:hypothetical protein